MKHKGFIKGIVKNNDNVPLKDIVIAIVSGPSHPDIASISGADGKFSLGNLSTGKYVIKATGNNVESENIQINVYPLKDVFVEIWLGTSNEDDAKIDIFPLDESSNEVDEL